MPLETPTVPNINERTQDISAKTDQIMHNPYENKVFFEQAERQVAPQSNEKWDLNEEPKAFDLDTVSSEVESYTAAPDYIEGPKTRAQEIEESLFYLNDKQILQYALDISKALRTMSKLV